MLLSKLLSVLFKNTITRIKLAQMVLSAKNAYIGLTKTKYSVTLVTLHTYTQGE